jgi:hypothetical protein
MRQRGTPVSREALYDEVWTDAVTVVAPRYGLSDVGLVKICKKLGVPVPPRGYWAKVKAGRPTRKVPLPALPAGARDVSGPIPLSEQEAAMHARVREALQQTRERHPSVSVPAELVDPQPLVRAVAARLKRRDGWDHPAGVRSAPKEVLDLQVTRNTLDRALRLMDTLDGLNQLLWRWTDLGFRPSAGGYRHIGMSIDHVGSFEVLRREAGAHTGVRGARSTAPGGFEIRFNTQSWERQSRKPDLVFPAFSRKVLREIAMIAIAKWETGHRECAAKQGSATDRSTD